MDSHASSYKLAIAAEENVKEKEYWLKKLSGHLVKSHFTYDFKKEKYNQNNLHGHAQVEKARFSSDLFTGLMELSKGKGQEVKLHMILVTGLFILLKKYSGNEDIILGSPLLKQETGREFINTVLLFRNRVDDRITFKDLLLQVRETIIQANKNQNYPMKILLEQLNIPVQGKEFPLFDVVVLLENLYDKKFIRHIHYNMGFSFTWTEQGIESQVEYSGFLYRESTIKQIIRHYMQVLGQAASDVNVPISNIEVLSEEERTQLLFDFNNTSMGADCPYYPTDQPLHRLFEEQAERTPDHTALVVGNPKSQIPNPKQEGTRGLAPLPVLMSITYRELNQKSNQLAHLLRKKGVWADTIVALMMEASLEMIIAILGILKAGAAYLNIAPEYPQERILYMLEDSRASILLTKEKISKKIPFTKLAGLHIHDSEPGINHLHITEKRPQIKNFDSLPEPDRSLVDYKKYHQFIGMALARHTFSLQATRGCPFRCAFCHKIWPKTHVYRSAENIFHEIKTLYDIGARRFVFVDDIFNFKKENCQRFFQIIIKNGLKAQLFFSNGFRGDILTRDLIDLMVEAGTVVFDFSLESASPRLQKLMQKNLNLDILRDNINYIINRYPDVMIELQTMLGFPSETEKEAMMTLDFIKSLKWIDFPYIHFVRIFPETDMAKIAIEHGVSDEAIARSNDLAFHEYSETMPFPEEFSKLYQTKFFQEYFLVKERFCKVLRKQMKILTENELIQKYDSYFPTHISNFPQLLDLVGISENDLKGAQFLNQDYMAVPQVNEKIKKIFPAKQPEKNALRILLMDLSQFFSHEAEMFYDVKETPIGLMYLLTFLNKQYGNKINGKIIKSRMDFDSYKELKAIIEDFKPDIIGIRTLTHYKDFFHKTISYIKQWGIDVPIIAGGPYATSSYPEVLRNRSIDIVVLGEGEITFSELIGKILENDGNLPGEDVLKDIKGIAFIKNKRVNREIICLNEIGEIPGTFKEEDRNRESSVPMPGLAYIIYTSGSTGKSKGVMVEHKNVIAYMNAFQNEFNVKANDIVLQHTSYSFDTFVEEVYPVLSVGGRIAVPAVETAMDVNLLGDFIRKHHITIVDCTPLVLNVLNEQSASYSFSSVHTFISGGDVLKKEYVDNLLTIAKVYNTYGPTETTVCTTYYRLPPGNNKPGFSLDVPIGKPIANYKLYILDKTNNLVPIGVTGELCVTGPGVTRGYLNQPELTLEKFDHDFWDYWDYHDEKKSYKLQNTNYKQITNYKLQINQKLLRGVQGGGFLEKSPPGRRRQKIYNAGDLARWLPDGNIEFSGRKDHQVKIRGYRVETGEIESRLSRDHAIKEAVVTAREDEDGNKYLCAYVVADKELGAQVLHDRLARYLPDYMVPAFFVQLERLPLTVNGKIDKKALPEPQLNMGTRYVEPQNHIQKRMQGLWHKVLKFEPISIHDNFFTVGGHSLRGLQLINEIHKEFDLKIPLAEIFKTPTIEGLSVYIEKSAADRDDRFFSIEPVEEKEYYELSSAQKRLYAHHHMNKDHLGYNMPFVLRLQGKFEKEKLEETFKRMIKRHEVFRTSFEMIKRGEHPFQRTHKQVQLPIEYYERTGEAEELVNSFTRPFDLSKAPLLRVRLVKTGEEAFILMVDIHHIISDGTSVSILTRELIPLYQGKELAPLRIRYRDFSEWQNREKQKGTIKKQERYWLEEFEASVPVLNMPIDYERPKTQTIEADSIQFEIDIKSTVLLKKMAIDEGVTVYMVLLAIFNILLSKECDQEDITIGLPTVGRRHVDLTSIFGFFINMLALRNFPGGEKTFQDFLLEVKEKTLKAYDNQDYQFEDLVDKVLAGREASRNSLVDVVFIHQNIEVFSPLTPETSELAEVFKPSGPGMKVKHHEKHRVNTLPFDLVLFSSEREEKLDLSCKYRTKLFKEKTIDRLIKNFKKTISTVLDNKHIQLKDIQISHDLLAVKSDIFQEEEGDFGF